MDSKLKVLLEVKLWCNQILAYHFGLNPSMVLPSDIQWLLPYGEPETQRCMTLFYNQFYKDHRKRILILGINPGRFGAGLTGVPFTDPIRLEQLGISNTFKKKPELSSVFIYDMIAACGGPETFFHKYYITSLSPLGFVKGGKNYNYYDDTSLSKIIRPFIIENIETQLKFGADTSVAFCLGQGKNFEYLEKLNNEFNWWGSVIPLPHPRWIMQYRLKQKAQYIKQYKDLLFSP